MVPQVPKEGKALRVRKEVKGLQVHKVPKEDKVLRVL
jgi:hypothetical protein